tara:strand:+ start:222 stop:326 length:105 start_codon:yes stop_codon:yes gene_type:complete
MYAVAAIFEENKIILIPRLGKIEKASAVNGRDIV